MAYYQMALDAGIHMMPSRLLEENGRAHFMTRRFDRGAGSTRHHIQTFCALKHFDYNQVESFSYEQIFQTMRELKLSYPNDEQMFRGMVLNVVACNCDDHTKHFAFLLKKVGQWELAHDYDVCHAYHPKHQWVSHHALSINGKRTNINKEDFLQVGKSIRFQRAAEAFEKISFTVTNWNDYAEEVGVEPTFRDETDSSLAVLN